MLHSFVSEARQSWRSMKAYLCQEKALRWFCAVLIVLFYGIRLLAGDLFIDSDIMLARPDEMLLSWYGHQRFGLVLTKRLLSLGRLLPCQQNVMLALALWFLVLSIGFCLHKWSGGAPCYRKGMFLFAAVFLTAPCFAEQFYFLLQAFETAAAMLFCVAAAYCAGRWIYDKKSAVWCLFAILFIVWAFGSYQAFPAFYIALALISYLTVFLHGEEPCGLREGLLHILIFLIGFVASQVCSRFLCSLYGASASYIGSMFRWRSDPLDACLENFRLDVLRIYFGAWPVFFSRWFRYMAVSASCLALFLGLARRSRKFSCFLLALALLPVTPALLTLITAAPQPIRGQMTYPLVYAYYVLLLYVGLCLMPGDQRVIRGARKSACMLFALLAMALGWQQGITMNQLWETAHEAYVADVLTANRMYGDICRVADRTDMEQCKVVFVGTRKASLAGEPVLGDVIGHSFFEWDAQSLIGVSLRVNTFFQTLGLKMEVPAGEDYQAALAGCQGRPDWPALDSVFLLDGDTVVVKLSDTK